jgi:hypothetical protein
MTVGIMTLKKMAFGVWYNDTQHMALSKMTVGIMTLNKMSFGIWHLA